MVALTKPQQWKKEESKRLRGERDQINFIDLGFERLQVVRSRKVRRRQDDKRSQSLWLELVKVHASGA